MVENFGSSPIEAAYPAWVEMQKQLDDQMRRLALGAIPLEALKAECSNYSGVKVAHDLFCQQLGISPRA